MSPSKDKKDKELPDIKYSFLYPFFCTPDPRTNSVESTLSTEGGELVDFRLVDGDDIAPQGHRSFAYWTSEYTFEPHSVRALVTGEAYALLIPSSKLVLNSLIRVRLGDYDFSDPFTRDLAELLGDLSRRAVRDYPSGEAKDLITRFMF